MKKATLFVLAASISIFGVIGCGSSSGSDAEMTAAPPAKEGAVAPPSNPKKNMPGAAAVGAAPGGEQPATKPPGY